MPYRIDVPSCQAENSTQYSTIHPSIPDAPSEGHSFVPIVHRFQPEYNLVVSVWSELLSDDEALESYAWLYAQEEWIPGMNELADLRTADMSKITVDGMRGIAKLVRAAVKGKGVEFRSAVVVTDEIAEALVRMYGAINEESKEDACVFLETERAAEWLGVPEEVLDG
jgi:hypothetical protein